MTDEELTKQEWIYIGPREEARGSGVVYGFLDADGKERFYGKPPTTASLGGVYEVEANSKSARIKGARWLRGSDDPRISQWDLESRAARARQAAQSAARKVAKDKPMGDLTLSEVRTMLDTRFGSSRSGLLAAVLEYIRA